MDDDSNNSLGLSGLLEELLGEQKPADVQKAVQGLPPEPQLKESHHFTPGRQASPPDAPADAGLAGFLDELEELKNLAPPEVNFELEQVRAQVCVLPQDESMDSSGLVPGVDLSSVPRPWAREEPAGVAALTSRAEEANPGFRDYMEDGHAIVDPLCPVSGEHCGLFAVYDGHGGRETVDYVEANLHELFRKEMKSISDDMTPVCTSVFHKLDSQLAMMGNWSNGCTATVALVRGRPGSPMTLHVANVGDSRALLLGDSNAWRVSKDHKPSDAGEARRVEAEGGRVKNGRVSGSLAVSRALGDHRLKSHGVSCVPDVSTSVVAAGHALIIASDGLWDVVPDDEACRIFASCVTEVVEGCRSQDVLPRLRESVAQALVDRAKEAGSRDNILVLVVFL